MRCEEGIVFLRETFQVTPTRSESQERDIGIVLYLQRLTLVTRGGLEPPTKRLRVFCSTIELAGRTRVRKITEVAS